MFERKQGVKKEYLREYKISREHSRYKGPEVGGDLV